MSAADEPVIDELRRMDFFYGFDGFYSIFYQSYWEIINSDLLAVVFYYFIGSATPKALRAFF